MKKPPFSDGHMFAAAPARRFSAVIVAVLVCAGALGSRADAGELLTPDPVSAAGVLVHVEEDARLSDVARRARGLGVDLGTFYEEIGVFVARGGPSVLARLHSISGVDYLEANRPLEYFTNTSHEATKGQRVLDGKVRSKGKIVDGSGVGVAVVDTGVDGTHPDLADRMGGNVRFVCTSPGLLLYPASECGGPKQAVEVADSDTPGAGGHGTHVAGIVSGTGTSSDGEIHGAAPGATLYGVGIGTVLLVENALDGLRWVLENHDKVSPKIRVVNNSWGGGYSRSDPGDPTTGAITKLVDLLVEEGVTVVFAAGNNGGNGATPTSSVECVNPTPGVVCVANYNDMNSGIRSGTIDPSSSRGKEDDPSTWPDVSAPGTAITSTCRATLPVCNALGGQQDPTQFYATMTGTSMAAPHVAGIIAQLYQVNPRLKPARVESILENTAFHFRWGSPYTKDPANRASRSSFEKGHGLVDALAAVRVVKKTR